MLLQILMQQLWQALFFHSQVDQREANLKDDVNFNQIFLLIEQVCKTGQFQNALTPSRSPKSGEQIPSFSRQNNHFHECLLCLVKTSYKSNV